MERVTWDTIAEWECELRIMDSQRKEEELRLVIALLESLSLTESCTPEDHDLMATRLCSGNYIMTLPYKIRDKWCEIDGAREILDRNRYLQFVDDSLIGNKFMVNLRHDTLFDLNSITNIPMPYNTSRASN